MPVERNLSPEMRRAQAGFVSSVILLNNDLDTSDVGGVRTGLVSDIDNPVYFSLPRNLIDEIGPLAENLTCNVYATTRTGDGFSEHQLTVNYDLGDQRYLCVVLDCEGANASVSFSIAADGRQTLFGDCGADPEDLCLGTELLGIAREKVFDDRVNKLKENVKGLLDDREQVIFPSEDGRERVKLLGATCAITYHHDLDNNPNGFRRLSFQDMCIYRVSVSRDDRGGSERLTPDNLGEFEDLIARVREGGDN